MFVYLVTNNINGKKYVGQHSGDNLESYWQHCVTHALNGVHGKDRLLYRAIRKYGASSFSICPLVIVNSKREMDRYEIGLIAAFGLQNPEKGYNLAAGGLGSLGVKPSAETLRKLSESHKGLKQSEETKRRRAEKHRGMKRSEETKKRISDSLKGNTNCLGRIESEETRRKKSEVNIGNQNSLGVVRSPEYRKKMSEAQKRRRERERNGNSVQHEEVRTRRS